MNLTIRPEVTAWRCCFVFGLISLVLGSFFARELFAAQQATTPQQISQSGGPEALEQRVFQIFEQNCHVCHSEIVQRSSLDLRTRASILKGGAHGPSIVAGNAKESLLYKLITHQQEPVMPMGGKLADEEIAVIASWIDSLSPDEVIAANASTRPLRPPGAEITETDRKF